MSDPGEGGGGRGAWAPAGGSGAVLETAGVEDQAAGAEAPGHAAGAGALGGGGGGAVAAPMAPGTVAAPATPGGAGTAHVAAAPASTCASPGAVPLVAPAGAVATGGGGGGGAACARLGMPGGRTTRGGATIPEPGGTAGGRASMGGLAGLAAPSGKTWSLREPATMPFSTCVATCRALSSGGWK